MKQSEILYRFFKTKNDDAIKFCVNVNADYKLNVLGVHYIIVNKVGKLPKNYNNRTRHYIGGNDIKKIKIIDTSGISGAYIPAAEYPVKSLETVVPDSMDYEIHSAVANLKEDVGSINEYVKQKLKIDTDEELAKFLSGEQVDAVAMAIYNIEEKGQGMIIGDQTGIGKGRVAASIIRYGVKNGYKPIFVTEKPNLFSDMYRDLKAIGCEHFNPFIINTSESKTNVRDENGKVVYSPPVSSVQKRILESTELPDEYDYIMLTYSQVSSEKPTVKQSFISKYSENNIMILDESHNAGGDIDKSNTARFFYNAVKNAKGVVFLSATFAKRPDNMPLYAVKTCLSDANMSNQALIDAVVKGGVALQEVLSSNLVASGQMIRRERSYDGIEVNYITLNSENSIKYGVKDAEEEHFAISDRITDILRDIIDFQRNYIAPVINGMDEEIKKQGDEVKERKGVRDLGVDSPPFFSKLFNVVNMMLFSIKSEAVADRAIQRLKEGKKPVIAFANTMGSFLETMENDRGDVVGVGDKISTDFSEVLKRGLEGVLRYTIKKGNGNSYKAKIDLSTLSPDAQGKYFKILDKINKVATGISISPIDVIIKKIEDAGYKVAEVTGRKLKVNFLGEDMSIGVIDSRKKENVDVAFRKFNNNEVDVLMINQSGSTGASAHAIVTPKVPLEKVKQRVMIILQAELDINREVQKRGRINRTGQVYKPIYDYIISPIPAEQRLMMMLQKKLKSLDANTTSNQKNSQALLKSDDFLNKYGDKIVAQYLIENPIINDILDNPLKIKDGKPEILEGAASKVSGRVAVLSTKDQQEFYKEIIESYEKYVKYLIQAGEYDLEVEEMNLQAETLSKEIAVVGSQNGNSVFSEHSYLEECLVNNLKKPFKKYEIENKVAQILKDKSAEEIKEELINKLDEHFEREEKKSIELIEQQYQKLINGITNESKYKKLTSNEEKRTYYSNRQAELKEQKETTLKNTLERLSNQKQYLKNYFSYFRVGKAYYCPFASYNNENVPGVFLGFKINEKKPNPFAPSAITACFAVANSLKYIELVLSGEQGAKVQSAIGASYNLSHYESEQIINNWDELCKGSSSDRRKAYIYTGNILQAYSVASSGKLISYTTIDGEIKKGILMPESWQPLTKDGARRTVVPITLAKKVIASLSGNGIITTDNGISFMRKYNGDYRITTSSASIEKWGWLVKNADILNYILEFDGFQKQSGTWVGSTDEEGLQQIIDIIYSISKATVSLAAGQLELIKNDIDINDKQQEKKLIFPKLVELEVKLFKLIEEDSKGYALSGALGLPARTYNALDLLRTYKINPTSEKEKYIANLIDEVAKKTNNFKNPENLSEERIEVKPLLIKEKIPASEWIKRKKSFKRSEADVVEWLAIQVKEMLKITDRQDTIKEEDDEGLILAEAEAEALILIQEQRLELLKYLSN
jgi:hypothetical protein